MRKLLKKARHLIWDKPVHSPVIKMDQQKCNDIPVDIYRYLKNDKNINAIPNQKNMHNTSTIIQIKPRKDILILIQP